MRLPTASGRGGTHIAKVRTAVIVIHLIIPYTVITIIYVVTVSVPVKTYVIVMGTVMSAGIRTVVIWFTEIEMVMVGISNVNSEVP